MALLERLIDITISINPNAEQKTFDGTDSNTVTLSGLRCSARIQKAGGPSDCTLDLTVYGMTKSRMNQLSTLGMQINLIPQNKIVLSAGDSMKGQSTAFIGSILAAYADFQSAPEVAFRITAHSGLPESVIPAEASSFRGSTDVATVMSGLATKMGLRFENSGVDAKVPSPYLSGSLRSQVRDIAKAAGISQIIDDGVLAIWPRNGSRGGQVPLLSPSSGMIGYPTYTAYGIMLTTIYNPSIGMGGKIKVESELKPASGEWSVYRLDHDLESMTPNGKWFSTVLAYNPKLPNKNVPVA